MRCLSPLPAGGRGVVEGLSKQLGLPPDKMAPSANALYWCAGGRRGGSSSDAEEALRPRHALIADPQ